MTGQVVRLGDVADMLSGFSFKSQHFLDDSEDGIYLVRGDNVQQGFIRWGDKAKKWRSDAYEDFSRYQLQKNDVILAMDRPIVGGGLKLAWIKDQDLPSLLVQRVTRIRGIRETARTNYLRYALSTPSFVAHIDRITTGANIPHISGKDIASFEFVLPQLGEQDRIVEFIAAYDDLIETNQLRISLLEESARLLYREWFVDRRYPGHSLENDESGLPHGWVIRPLAEVSIVNRASLSTKDKPDEIQYVDIASVETGIVLGASKMFYVDAPGRARRLVQHGDVIWSCVRPNRRSYALLWEPDANLIVSTGFAVLTASGVPFSYLYLATTSDEFVAYLTNRATGAAYPAVSGKDFEEAPLLCPSSEVLQSFHEQCLS
jgi:type I restriction enzyme S subunit